MINELQRFPSGDITTTLSLPLETHGGNRSTRRNISF
jgi:hypothetical protein